MSDPWHVRRVAPARWIVEAISDTRDVAIVEQKYDRKKNGMVLWCWACTSVSCADVAAVAAELHNAAIDTD